MAKRISIVTESGSKYVVIQANDENIYLIREGKRNMMERCDSDIPGIPKYLEFPDSMHYNTKLSEIPCPVVGSRCTFSLLDRSKITTSPVVSCIYA